jgi:uncharacterized membrane protein YkvA (DUF1232 family)
MWTMRVRRFLRAAGRDGLMLLFALRDPATPRALKLGIVALALYAISPIDLVPDVLLLFGWADDVALLLMGIPFLARRLPHAVRARAAAQAEQWIARFGFARGRAS